MNKHIGKHLVQLLYFTLKELKDYRRSHGVIKHSGYISPKQSEDLDNGITPDSWCQRTSDTTWIHREWEDDMTESLDNLIEALTTRLCEEFWIYKFSRDRKQQIQRNEDRIRIAAYNKNVQRSARNTNLLGKTFLP